MQENNLGNTPLDSFETKQLPAHPALTWLIWYGAYLLLTRFGYTIFLPLITNFVAYDAQKLQAAYQIFNLVVTLGNVAIATAIVIFVKHKLCRVIFILTILSSLYSLIMIIHALKTGL